MARPSLMTHSLETMLHLGRVANQRVAREVERINARFRAMSEDEKRAYYARNAHWAARDAACREWDDIKGRFVYVPE